MHKWIIDKKEEQVSSGAFLTWSDDVFFTVDYNGKKYNGEIINSDVERGTATIKLNHRVFNISREHSLSDLIRTMGLDKVKLKKLTYVDAPMPGRVLKLYAEIGREISLGDPLLSLEAMKMENIIKAEGEGIVDEILIKEDQVVDKGAILIRFK